MATQARKSVKKSTPAAVKAAPKKETKKPNEGKGEFAEYCAAQDINPKVARAKLRRAGLKSGGSWKVTAEVKKVLAS